MKQITFSLLLLVSCQKVAVTEALTMPDLLQFNLNTNAVRMYSEPKDWAETDTSFYFQSHVYTMVEKPTRNGMNRYINCAGIYTMNTSALVIRWKEGPLSGLREVLLPVEQRDGFTALESRYRRFWLKIE